MVTDKEIEAADTAIWKCDWLPPSKCKILAKAALEAAEKVRGDRTCIVSIKNKDGAYDKYSVPEEVDVYIRQLETCIKNPKESKLTYSGLKPVKYTATR